MQNSREIPRRRSDRSPPSLERLRIRNRRKRYLEQHPDYFTNPSLELADPLAYDRLIRTFQSAAEREADGMKKGYSGVMEADLYRSEAKLEALRHTDPSSQVKPMNKEEGEDLWRQQMQARFVEGLDDQFDYQDVDSREDYDDQITMERERQEEWFDEEEPEWIKDGANDQQVETDRSLAGQTGVQDY